MGNRRGASAHPSRRRFAPPQGEVVVCRGAEIEGPSLTNPTGLSKPLSATSSSRFGPRPSARFCLGGRSSRSFDCTRPAPSRRTRADSNGSAKPSCTTGAAVKAGCRSRKRRRLHYQWPSARRTRALRPARTATRFRCDCPAAQYTEPHLVEASRPRRSSLASILRHRNSPYAFGDLIEAILVRQLTDQSLALKQAAINISFACELRKLHVVFTCAIKISLAASKIWRRACPTRHLESRSP